MSNAAAIRLPGPSDRISVVGRTGSGKTVAAVWHLSNADFDKRPWVIIDYKDDELINAIQYAQHISFDDDLPTHPGIYILKVLPNQEELISEWFQRVHQQENVGIYVDEGYMIDRHDQWFNACLTQGRSKQIPMIVLSQRPVWMSRFVFSEATFFQVFDLSHDKDFDKVREYIKDRDGLMNQELENYHSFYYDVGKKKLVKFLPVPDGDVLLSKINARLEALQEKKPRRRTI